MVGCTDTLNLRQFGPKTLRHHRDGSKLSRQFGSGAKASVGHSVPVPHCLQLSHFLICELSNNKQCNALYGGIGLHKDEQ